MGTLRIVFLTDVESPDGSHGEKLCSTVSTLVTQLHYGWETVALDKLDSQEEASVEKFLHADVVMMDVTNRARRPTLLYHKGKRETMDCKDDILFMQTSDRHNTSAMQDLKEICQVKQLILYRYDEQNAIFYDVTTASVASPPLLTDYLQSCLQDTANQIRHTLSDRYITRMEKYRSEAHDAATQCNYLRQEICDEILTDANQKYATPKLIKKLMCAFQDLEDFNAMIELNERCSTLPHIAERIESDDKISYLAAFARNRRNQGDDWDQALNILELLHRTQRIDNELSNDISCLCGRIYKDRYIESDCHDRDTLTRAIEKYRQGFDANPNIHAGINLLLLLAITTDDLKTNDETYNIICHLNVLLGRKGRSLKDLSDYWDVATYFELHAVQHDWPKACQGALQMYLLDPQIWHLKSTINNLIILHKATRMRGQEGLPRTPSSTPMAIDDGFSFWIDFFNDAIHSNSASSDEDRQLPALIPILVCDNCKKADGTKIEFIYMKAHLQSNFHTGQQSGTIVIRLLDQHQHNNRDDLTIKIEMNSIRSIIDSKRDNRAIFLYAHDSNESFSSVELHIYFSSTQRRAVFNEKISKCPIEACIPDEKPVFDLEFERDQFGQRKILGQGTYGRVYVAQDRSTLKKFAVKEIPMRNPTFREMLENEIQMISKFNHKNIVSYHGTAIDSQKSPKIFQVIMEYVDGQDLSKHLARSGPMTEASIRNHTRQLLEGVKYLHEHKILHRDIKSANIIINSRGEIKITDFGTSKRLSGLHLCTENNVGTIHYMAPDVVSVSPMGYGPEVDIWSVGCTVIEMATGKRPFHDIANRHTLMLKLGFERKSPDIPAELSETVKDFLAKCFEPTVKRPSAKDLLNHPFLKYVLSQ